MEKSRKPKIRFKGYNDDWEQRKVQDVADRFDNLRIPVAANLRVHGTTPYYGANGIQDYVDGFTHDGEFVLVAEDGANDLKNYPVKCVNGRVWVNNHAHVLQGKARIADNSFLAFAISQSDIESLLVGGGRAKLNAETLMSIEFRLPCLQEQYRIGEYLSQLDNLITLHQRKLDKLVNVKKSMLEKMFPQQGSKIPEIRFCGFTDDWEQRKLDSLCKLITKQTGFDYSETIKPALVTDKELNTYSFIQNKDFEGENINLDTDFYIPIEVAERFPKIILDMPSLLISISGKIGNVGYYGLKTKAFIGGAVGICKLKEDIGSMLVYALQSEAGQTYFRSLIKASSHANITVEDIRNIIIKLPHNERESQKVAEYFCNLDHLITLHQRKLDKLVNVKKSMLEKMFI